MPVAETPVAVAQAHVERLRIKKEAISADQIRQAEHLASELHVRLRDDLDRIKDGLVVVFREFDPEVRASVVAAKPPDERARHWRSQLIAAANAVDFYTNWSDGTWWVRLHLTVLGATLRYLVFVQKVGHGETGVLAVTAYAKLLESGGDAGSARALSLLDLGPDDSVTLRYDDDPGARWAEIKEFADRTLAAAVDQFSVGLS